MKDTVNEALRRSALRQTNRVAQALTRLGEQQYQDREGAWRSTT
jgi:hypothetical protein